MSGKACIKGKCCFKGVLAIVIFTVIASVVGNYFWMDLYKDVWMADEFKHLWRPMEAEQWKNIPVINIIYSIAFVIGYAKFARGMRCPLGTRFGGGAIFGIYIWIFYGLLSSTWVYTMYPVSMELASIVAKEVLVTNIIGGGLVALLLAKKSCSKDVACC